MAPPPAPQRLYRLRRRLLLVISLLVALVVVSGIATVLTGLASRRAILEAHDLEVASRRAALLSVTAREQYIHEAHTIILRDRSHVEHHDAWVSELSAKLAELRPGLDAEAATKLDDIGKASRDLSQLFSTAILPAIDRQEWHEVHHAHDRANALVDRMTEHADSLALHFDERAMAAERRAEQFIRFALILATAVCALAAALALIAGRKLWSSFSTPLASLERVAERVTAGDRSARVEPVAAVELAAVADAFNRMLDALSRTEADLVASERLAAIGRVAAGVAHEINNPIAVIRGYVKTMAKEAEKPELREELSILDEEAAACQRIAEELLMYTRSPVLSPRPVQAEELIRNAVEHCDGGPGRAPPVLVDAEPAFITVDPLRIRQVVVNLVTNAREATSGTPEGDEIVVRGRQQDDGYRIEILDRGAGIPEEARERLFEPFFTTRRDGTGLGLAVCYGLVTAHGGTIRAEPRPGGGSQFVIDLPGVLIEEARESQERA
ncbi:sensor histidine kinase [Sorangium sp. So ce1182]|uniref:sensor histidine kinase n=1 Tax=Sorangium sp. So ce1182 TaxID=3133334 RepID=UPI003F618B4A